MIESELHPSDADGGSSREECDVDNYCKRMVHMRKNLFSRVDQNIKSAQGRYKRDFDRKHRYKKELGMGDRKSVV